MSPSYLVQFLMVPRSIPLFFSRKSVKCTQHEFLPLKVAHGSKLWCALLLWCVETFVSVEFPPNMHLILRYTIQRKCIFAEWFEVFISLQQMIESTDSCRFDFEIKTGSNVICFSKLPWTTWRLGERKMWARNSLTTSVACIHQRKSTIWQSYERATCLCFAPHGFATWSACSLVYDFTSHCVSPCAAGIRERQRRERRSLGTFEAKITES